MIAPVWKMEVDDGEALSRQRRGSVAMSIPPAGTGVAPDSWARLNTGWNGDTAVSSANTFARLDDADRTVLSDWLLGARAKGIDTVMDFSLRPWNIIGASVIIGVFEIHKPQASWLAVQHERNWTMARCADGFVSDVSASLSQVLALIALDASR